MLKIANALILTLLKGINMNGYIALYLGEQYEIQADNVWSAKQKALKDLQVSKKKAWQVTIHLSKVNGADYKHTADF